MISRAFTLAAIRARRAAGMHQRRQRMPRALAPDPIRLEYAKAIRTRVVAPARDALESLYPELARIVNAAADAHARHDADEGARVNAMIDDLSRRWTDRMRPRDLEALADRFATRTAGFQHEQLQRQVRAGLGVDVPLHDNVAPQIRAFTAENVALIKSIPSTYFAEIERILTRGITSGRRWEDIAPELAERYGITERRARLIARDQVGKLNGDLNRVRQQRMGVTSYVWSTVNDGRVRDEHAARQGQRFAWDNPPADGHPGQPVNCRCWASPDLSALLDDSGPAPATGRGVTPRARTFVPEVITPAPTVETPKPTSAPITPAAVAPAPVDADGARQPSNADTVRAFGRSVFAVASQADAKRVGDDRVWIHDVWARGKAQGLWTDSLPEFKFRLLEAQRASAVNMSRADLVEAYHPSDVDSAEIAFLEAQYHFIRTDLSRKQRTKLGL